MPFNRGACKPGNLVIGNRGGLCQFVGKAPEAAAQHNRHRHVGMHSLTNDARSLFGSFVKRRGSGFRFHLRSTHVLLFNPTRPATNNNNIRAVPITPTPASYRASRRPIAIASGDSGANIPIPVSSRRFLKYIVSMPETTGPNEIARNH